jgi:hypothetical protein
VDKKTLPLYSDKTVAPSRATSLLTSLLTFLYPDIKTPKFSTESLSDWRPRRIGVFFSLDSEHQASHENGGSPVSPAASWSCLVLIQPHKIKPQKHPHDLHFCYRKIQDADPSNNRPPNATTKKGRRRYTIEEHSFQEIVRYICTVLLVRYLIHGEGSTNQRCANLVTHLGRDILWGWEEFATQVVQFAAVFPPLASTK